MRTLQNCQQSTRRFVLTTKFDESHQNGPYFLSKAWFLDSMKTNFRRIRLAQWLDKSQEHFGDSAIILQEKKCGEAHPKFLLHVWAAFVSAHRHGWMVIFGSQFSFGQYVGWRWWCQLPFVSLVLTPVEFSDTYFTSITINMLNWANFIKLKLLYYGSCHIMVVKKGSRL